VEAQSQGVGVAGLERRRRAGLYTEDHRRHNHAGAIRPHMKARHKIYRIHDSGREARKVAFALAVDLQSAEFDQQHPSHFDSVHRDHAAGAACALTAAQRQPACRQRDMATAVDNHPALRIHGAARKSVEEQRRLFQQWRLAQLEYRGHTVAFEDLGYVCLRLFLAAYRHIVHGETHAFAFERAMIETSVALSQRMDQIPNIVEEQIVVHDAIAGARRVAQRAHIL
jgi:hypothetical protein